MILYALYRIGTFLALALPLRVSYRMASALAGMYCDFSKKDRETVTNNLKTVLGNTVSDAQLAIMVRQVFQNFAKYLVDFFRFTIIDESYIKRFVTLEGTEHIDAALKDGKGVILLSAHIGNWELGGAALSLSGYPVNAVVLTHQNKKINDFFTRQRLKGKMRPIEIGASLKACYRTIKSNGLLALLGDRDFTKSGVVIDFFGKPALMPKGPGVFAYRHGSAILPTFMVRNPDDSFRLFIGGPILADCSKEETAAIKEVAGRYLKPIESCIKQYPTQWYVFRNIWDNDGTKYLRPDTIL